MVENPQGVPATEKPSSTPTSGQTGQPQGGAPQGTPAIDPTQFVSKTEYANLEKKLGEQGEELGRLRKIEQTIAPHAVEINQLITQKSQGNRRQQLINNIAERYDEDTARTFSELLTTEIAGVKAETDSALSVLSEEIIKLKNPEFKELEPAVSEVKQKIQKGQLTPAEALYLAAKGLQQEQLVEKKTQEKVAIELDRLKREGGANLGGGVTAPPGAPATVTDEYAQRLKAEIRESGIKEPNYFVN